jgi:hypothetical protein
MHGVSLRCYDAASRLQSVTDNSVPGNPYSAGYLYLANSRLVSQIAFANNGTTQMATTKQYDFPKAHGSSKARGS